MNTVVRHHKFDAGHRLINYQGLCKNVHGHEYKLEINCAYSELNQLGLGIDFSDIKKLYCSWIDMNLDHGFLAAPNDHAMIRLLEAEGNKHFITKLGNPSAENISKELLYVGRKILNDSGLTLVKLKLFETTNCWVETSTLTQKEIEILQHSYQSVFIP